MPTIDDLNKWCLKARDLMSRIDSEGPKAMTANTEGVIKLLGVMQSDIPTFGADYPGFRKEFDDLGTAAEKASRDVASKAIKKAEGKARVQQVSRDLRQLQLRLEVRIAQLDPTRSPEATRRAVQMSRHKPVYDNKRERVQEAIDELAPLPGTKTQVLALMGLLEAGRKAEPDYEAAYEALEGLSANLKTGREAAAKFGKGAGNKELALILTSLRQSIADFDAVAGVGDPNRVAAENAAITQALMNIDIASPDMRPAQIARARQNLPVRATQLDNDRKALVLENQAVQLLLKRLGTLASELRTIAPAEAAQALLAKVNAGRALWSTQQFKAAKDELDRIDGELTNFHRTHDDAYQAWQLLDVQLTDGLLTVERVATTPAVSSQPLFTNAASQLRINVNELRRGPVEAHDFAGAVAKAQQLKLVAEFAALKKMLEDAVAGKTVTPAFTSPQLLAQAQLARIDPAVAQSEQAMLGKLAELEQAGGSGTELRRSGDALMATCRQVRMAYLAGKASLSELETAVSVCKNGVDALIVQIGLLLNDPDKLTASQSVKGSETVKNDFAAKRVEAQQALAYLDDFDAPDNHPVLAAPPSLASLKERLTALEQRASGGDYVVDAMDKLASDAANKRGLVLQALESRRQASAETVTQLTRQIGTLKKDRSNQAAYFDGLIDRLTGLAAMAGSTVLSVMDDGAQKLLEFKTEVQALADAKSDPGKVNYAKVDAMRVELKRRLDAKAMKTYQPVAQARLLTYLKDVLPTQLPPLSPAEAMALLNKVLDEVVGLDELILANTSAHQQLQTDIGTQRQRIASLKTTAPGLYADLTQRLDTLAKAPASEVTVSTAALKTVRVLITAATDPADTSDPSRRTRLEKTAQVDLLRAAQAEAEFAAAVDVFKKDLQREAKEVHDSFGLYEGDRNSELYKLIATRLDDAEKEGKSGSAVVALGKLRVAEAAARAFIATPLKPAAAARKAVLAADRNWQVAVAAFVKNVNDLKNAVKKECDQDRLPAEQTAKTLAALEPLGSLFNALTFTDAARTLSTADRNPTEAAPKRRVEKEGALRVVHSYQRRLDENRLVAAVANNPFKPVPTVALKQALASLNGALQAS